MAGCGASGKEAEVGKGGPVAPVSGQKEGEERFLNSGPVELDARRDGGGKAWELSAESSRLGVDEDGKSRVFLSGVAGTVFEDGKVASRFTAKDAKADSEARSLVLSGGVTVSAEGKKATLVADKVRWIDERRVFAASGSVRIESPDWTLGPMDEVWALADLTKVGSPEKFK